MKKVLEKSNKNRKGVFWVIDNKLFAFPFSYDFYSIGIAKSGTTYNHKKLWLAIKPKGCNKPYNYYPRGRVDFSNKGKPVVYLNPNIITDDIISAVKVEFGLSEEPKIIADGSEHYKCYLDDGWKAEKN